MKTNSDTVLSVCFFVSIAFAVLFYGCEKESFEEGMNEYLKSMPSIASELPLEKENELVDTEVDTTADYIYHYDYYETAAGFNEQIVLNPQTDVIYPGALVKGESILDGTYTLISARRRPVTISTSLSGGNIVSVMVDDPKLSTVREAINSLMDQEYDVPPANMGFTIEQAYSEQQLDLSLHASYKGGGYDIKGGFDFSKTEIKTRLIAKFIQSYYTLDMDLPNEPSELFEEEVDRSLFGTFMPMYVSTVTFGRMALFTIESSLSETEVRAYLNASYAGVNAAGSTDFDELKAHSTMKVYILGGSGDDAGATVNGFEDFKNYIQEGGDYSKTSPGAPISYKLRYIKDNSIGRIVFAASYPIVTAIPRTDNIIYDMHTWLYHLDAHGRDAGGNLELYGNVYSWPKHLGPGVRVDHFARGSGNYLSVAESGEYTFPENTQTLRMWAGLKQSDTIMVLINLAEVDDWPDKDDHYGDQTFAIPVADIVSTTIVGQTFDKTKMRVEDGDDYVDFTMRFNYTMDRSDK